MKAFSPDEFLSDSSMFIDQPVEHLTSWLTTNPYKGCYLNCAYCFRVDWFPSNAPQMIWDVEEVIEKLTKHKDFIPNETPVSINNSSTDPLLSEVKHSTLRAIEIMESKRLQNPFIIITKLKFTQSDIVFLSKLKYVKIVIFISLSLIPKNIEPIPISPRIRNLKILLNAKIPCVLFFRPIVPEWNDSYSIIEKVLKIGQKYCKALCIGGLKITYEIEEALKKRGVNIEYLKEAVQKDIINEEIEKKILLVHKRLDLNVPVFKHSSCAVSYIFQIPNYNHFFRFPDKNCLSTCPESQQLICKNIRLTHE